MCVTGEALPRAESAEEGAALCAYPGASHSPGPTGTSPGSPPQEHRRATAGRSIGARRPEIRTHHHKNSSTRHQHPAARRLPQRAAGTNNGRGLEAVSPRARTRARVVGATRGSLTPRGGCRHREGVVDTTRGSLTPRGGYNARWCQQRASVRTTRAHANNARRRSSTPQRAAPIAPISTSSCQRRQRSAPAAVSAGSARRPGLGAPARQHASARPGQCRTQGRELGNTAPHTRAGSSPCVRHMLRKSGSLYA